MSGAPAAPEVLITLRVTAHDARKLQRGTLLEPPGGRPALWFRLGGRGAPRT